MRKGLTNALMAVAVFMMAIQATAMAPVIDEGLPDIVVGNVLAMNQTTPDLGFVYEDAMDLSVYTSDDSSDSKELIYSYRLGDRSLYRINAVAPLMNDDSTTAPPAANQLNGSLDPDDGDGNALTITVRNISATPSDPVADPSVVLDNQTTAMTLYASDGELSGERTIFLFTDDGGVDRLSPGATPSYQWSQEGGDTTGWTASATGDVTTEFVAGSGVCIQTVENAEANVLGSWTGPYGVGSTAQLQLIANSAYHIRAVVTSNQTEADKVPFWDLSISNFDFVPRGQTTTFLGQNGYGGNFLFLSNVGFANAATSADGTAFEYYWCPSPVSVDRWNATVADDFGEGPFGASNVDNRNGFLMFRILQSAVDENGNPTTATNGYKASGQLCLKSLFIERFDMDTLRSLDTIYDTGDPEEGGGITNGLLEGGNTSITDGHVVDANGDLQNQYSAVFLDGTLRIDVEGHGSGAANLEDPTKGVFVAQVQPGNLSVDYFNEAASTDDYPCPLDAHTLYLVTYSLSAPDATNEARPPAAMWIGADSFTNELICLSFVTLNFAHHGMPPFVDSDDDGDSDPIAFKAFFNSNYGTNHDPGEGFDANDFAWWACFRPRFMLGNNTGLGADQPKNGSIKIHRVQVERVAF